RVATLSGLSGTVSAASSALVRRPIAAGRVVGVGRTLVGVCTAVFSALLPEQPAATIAAAKTVADTRSTNRWRSTTERNPTDSRAHGCELSFPQRDVRGSS